jgi:hypothetical protein
MSEFNDIETQLEQVDNTLRERDMAIAYIDITKQYGPSKQLLLFVNYDNSLEEHVGLGLESLDLLDQHQFLLSNLNPDALDSLATEGLKDTVIKYRKWLLGGGAILAVTGGAAALPLLGVGALGVIANAKATPPVTNFVTLTKAFELAFRMEDTFTTAIPSTIDEKAWAKFTDDHVFNPGGGWESDVDDLLDKLTSTNSNFDKSGWTAEKYTNAAQWYTVACGKIEASAKKQAEKFDHVANALGAADKAEGKTKSYISKSVAESRRSMSTSTSILGDVKSLLTKVSHNLEKK